MAGLAALVATVVGAWRLRDTSLVWAAVGALAVQLLMWRRRRRVSSRLARLLPLGRRSRDARQIEILYIAAAAVGVALLAWSFLPNRL